MKNISFFLTTAQVRARSKRVTRRMGWRNLKPGELLQGVVKSRGRKHGEPIENLDVIRVETVTFEPLKDIGKNPMYAIQELVWEGFPQMTPDEFIAMFCESHKGCTPDTEITRIFFDYEPH